MLCVDEFELNCICLYSKARFLGYKRRFSRRFAGFFQIPTGSRGSHSYIVLRRKLNTFSGRSLPEGLASTKPLRHRAHCVTLVSLRNRTLVCDRAITCLSCRYLHFTPNKQCFLVLYRKICLKESEVWRKVDSNKIIVTLVT